MNRSIASRIAAAVIATAALGAASAAQAHSDVQFSIGIPARPVYVESSPVYISPTPVYVRPRHAYVPSAVYVYERPRRSYESAFEREHAWRRAEWRRRHWQHRHHGWDHLPSYGGDRD